MHLVASERQRRQRRVSDEGTHDGFGTRHANVVRVHDQRLEGEVPYEVLANGCSTVGVPAMHKGQSTP